MWTALFGAVKGLAGPALDAWKGRQERKMAVDVLKAKGAFAKDQAEASVTASIPEWEAIMAEATKSSWKDEVALVSLLLPIWGTFLGSVLQHYTGDAAVMEASKDMIGIIPEYGWLLVMAIGASFGVRVLK